MYVFVIVKVQYDYDYDDDDNDDNNDDIKRSSVCKSNVNILFDLLQCKNIVIPHVDDHRSGGSHLSLLFQPIVRMTSGLAQLLFRHGGFEN